jgi:DNA-binding transcriptional LysR family regulator
VHVVVVAAGTGHGQVNEHLRREGLVRRVRLTVPHFVAVGHILQATDLLTTVPHRLAQVILAPFKLAVSDPSVALPDIAINLFWPARYHLEPANHWLRGLFFRLFADQKGIEGEDWPRRNSNKSMEAA